MRFGGRLVAARIGCATQNERVQLKLALVREAEPWWDAAGDDAASLRWKRDRALLAVAASARAKRIERAWERIGAEAAGRSGNHQ
ncbi:MAG TPA: hypothetical protein VIJ43_09155 [Burkholderiales bacterium]